MGLTLPGKRGTLLVEHSQMLAAVELAPKAMPCQDVNGLNLSRRGLPETLHYFNALIYLLPSCISFSMSPRKPK